jgi:hypothetical protein
MIVVDGQILLSLQNLNDDVRRSYVPAVMSAFSALKQADGLEFGGLTFTVISDDAGDDERQRCDEKSLESGDDFWRGFLSYDVFFFVCKVNSNNILI